MPINVAIPNSYKLFADEPYPGNSLWTSQTSHDRLEKTGTNDPNEGVIQLRVSTGIGYDRTSDQFICGPDCNEVQIAKQLEKGGTKVRSSARKNVNGVPIWLIEASVDANGGGPSKIYLAYLATLIDTNVVVLTYGPPARAPAVGDQVWAEIKDAMAGSPPDPAWKAAVVDAPKRRTPPITAETRLPEPTRRVRNCIDAVKRVAGRLGYSVNDSRINEGRIAVTSAGKVEGVMITIRFVDFGDEILMASSTHASGLDIDKMPKAERAFFTALRDATDPTYPIMGTDDMIENMVLLKE